MNRAAKSKPTGTALYLRIEKMKTKRVFATITLVLPLFCAGTMRAADGFEGVHCGSDVAKAMIGKKVSNERVVVIEARHKDLDLKDLGAEEISDRRNLITWRICGDEYAVLEEGDVVKDVLKLPPHSKETPQFLGSCQLNGKDLPGTIIGVLKNEEGASTLSVLSAWKIDEKKVKFVKLETEGLRCGREGIVTEDGGR